jgi:two-component system, response regulator FlrC
MTAASLEHYTTYSQRPVPTRRLSTVEIEHVKWLVGHSIAEVECELICETLAHYNGNRTRSACELGISIRALRNKIQDYSARGISVPKPAVHHLS